MNNLVDITNFIDLKNCDVQEVVSRTRCKFDTALNQYEVSIWGYEYVVDLIEYKIFPKHSESPVYNGLIDLFILYFLMKSKDIKPSGKWVSQKDIPGGAGFFRGPHTIPTQTLTQRFGDDLSLFTGACKKADGKALSLADASFSFQITPTIPVAVLYWKGDQDFSSEAKLLFDQTIQAHLPLDIIFCLAVDVCYRLEKNII